MRFSSIGHIARLLIVALIGLMAVTVLHAQSLSPEDEYKKRIKINEDVQPLGDKPFGESISLYSGALSFEQTDVDLPGIGPAMKIIRSFKAPDNAANLAYQDFISNAFIDWSLEVPHIETLSAPEKVVSSAGAISYQWFWIDDYYGTRRCDLGTAPTMYTGQNTVYTYYATQWWHGYQLAIPGAGSQDLLSRDASNTAMPQMVAADGSPIAFPIVTKQHWAIGCLAQTANGQPGQGFLAVAPDGTKYWLDWMIYKNADRIAGGAGAPLQRRTVMMMASKVVDRFGNSVDYSYDGNGNLTGMSASDGRQLTVNYEGWGQGSQVSPTTFRIHSITAQPASGAARTWTYNYGSAANADSQYIYPRLQSVVLPDASTWSFDMAGLKFASLGEQGGCVSTDNGGTLGVTSTITMKHPSGLVGTFSLQNIVRGRSYVTKQCEGGGEDGYLRFPDIYAVAAIQEKIFSGAGLASQTWKYSYSPSNESWAQDCTSTACAASVYTDITDPDGNGVRYTFSNRFDASEGILQRKDSYAGAVGAALLQSEVTSYADHSQGPWPVRWGSTNQTDLNADQYETSSPEDRLDIQQDGDTYTWQAEAFNEYAQPTTVKRYNSITGQQPLEESTAYLNDTNTWVLGLPQTVTNVATGEVESSNAYNSLDELTSRARFGQTLMNYSYDDQGNLASFTDGNNHTTTLSNYKRGIPQSISYPDNASQSLAVDDFGQITSITDPLGATTGYQYDNAGRVVWVQPPGDDEVAWHATAYNYSFVPDAERGIAGNHWRRITTKGSSLIFQYYDAMLRPILTDTFISGDDTTHSNVRTDYDWRSQPTFASYPAAGAPDLGSISAGTHTSYDALGREVQRQSDSEQGLLTTTTGYQAGTTKSTTDPKGNTTTIAYQSFDQPAYDQPIKVTTPEGVTQTITRDIYGNPLQIAQSGTYNGQAVSIARNFTYDSYHRLCRRYEPESNSEVIDYDAANNLAWRATGVAVAGDASVCGRDQVADSVKFVNAYDAMNRVVSSTAPSGTQSTTYQYDAAGRVVSQVSGSVIQGYSYNKRGMLTSEVQWIPSLSYSRSIGYAHNAYGDIEKITYPDGAVFGLFPDALGRSTVLQGGDTLYVKNPSYFPDGGVQSYVLGNGISAVVQRNARQLPANLSYGQNGGLNFSEDYAYDADGNVNSIQDLVNGHNTQTLAYDGLSRLISAEAANSWGKETYSYDPLNNARGKTVVGAGVNLDLAFNYDTTNHLASMTRGSGGFSTYQYDARGNRTHEQIVYTTHDYSFDAKNQVLAVSGVANYAYDGDGRRVTKTLANGKLTHSFYSQAGKLMYAYDESTGQATDYLYWGGHLVARWVAGAPTYLLTDRLGSVVKEADATGAVTANYTYRPYGSEFEGPTQTEPGYTGHVSDPETALVYMQARYNDGSSGQFLSVDPDAPKPGNIFNFNRYEYVSGNPINNVDPTGRIIKVVGDSTFNKHINGDIGTISQGSGGRLLIEKLQATPNIIYIVQQAAGAGNQTQGDGSGISANGGKGTGSYVRIDLAQITGGTDANGSKVRPEYVGLAHELGHARAIDQGVQSYDKGNGAPGTTPPSEIQSVANENMVRREHQLPLRPSYYDPSPPTTNQPQ